MLIALSMTMFFGFAVSAQNHTRIINKDLSVPSGAGNTLTIFGAPTGSIKVTSHSLSRIEISARIMIEAPTQDGLDQLAAVTGFVTEEGAASVTIRTVGTHNKLGDKKFWKKIPKELLAQPFSIDYVLKVPKFLDLNINGGAGDLDVSGVEGSIRVSFASTKGNIALVGGGLSAQIGEGSLDVTFPARNWRSAMVEAQVAKGDLTVTFPLNLNADIDASALNGGSVVNEFPSLKIRDDRIPFTERSISARVGNGGVPIKLTTGNGTVKLKSPKL